MVVPESNIANIHSSSKPINPNVENTKARPHDTALSIQRGHPPSHMSQLCHGPVVTYYMVYHYTKRATLARLLANEGPAIYVVHLNRYFVIPP